MLAAFIINDSLYVCIYSLINSSGIHNFGLINALYYRWEMYAWRAAVSAKMERGEKKKKILSKTTYNSDTSNWPIIEKGGEGRAIHLSRHQMLPVNLF